MNASLLIREMQQYGVDVQIPHPALRLEFPEIGLARLFDFIEGLQFWVKNRAGFYLAVNRGFLLNFALSSDLEVLGKTDFDIEPHYIATRFRLDDERVLAGESVLNRIELVGRYDHTAVWCVTNKVPLRDASGAIVGTTGITQPLPPNGKIRSLCPDGAIARIIERFRERLDEPMDNVSLAKLAGLSVRAFERRFRQLFGVSPQHYLRRLRVRMACQALVYSETALAEIARDHGYCDQSHFGREFRRETGMSPRTYRERFHLA